MAFSGNIVAERCDFAKGDYIDNRYRIDKFLGEGTFGRVFKVQDRDSRVYALKLLKLWEVMAEERPNLLKRFDREYETGRIDSDYLVRSVGKGEIKGNPFIVMEFCSEGDLAGAVGKPGVDLTTLSLHVLYGLRDLHNNGKVHRDLKPENVLLRSTDHAVLTDFGISGDQNNRLTQRGLLGIPQQRFGTIAYMPPEQINPKRGNATVLPTTDIFSFGVMMYQLLTGNLPFGPLRSEGDMPLYITRGHNGDWDREMLRRSGNDKWLDLLEGCLAPNFKNRLQTINDVTRLMPAPTGVKINTGSGIRHDFITDLSRGVTLRVMQGEDLGRTYRLNEFFKDNSSVLTVGRDSADVWNNIKIREQETCYISRCHCTIERNPRDNSWTIRDGQWRSDCPIGLRFEHNFPCAHCSAACPQSGRAMKWKTSLNGTYVNSVEVDPNGARIKAGDIISIGDVKLRVEGSEY